MKVTNWRVYREEVSHGCLKIWAFEIRLNSHSTEVRIEEGGQRYV